MRDEHNKLERARSDHGGAADIHGKILADWKFPEYERHERTHGWFVTAGIIAAGMLVWAVWTGNYLFALILIMIAVIIVTHHYNQPASVEFQITSEGLQLGEHFYPFIDIAKFWIIYEPPEVKKLYFNFKSWLHPNLSIPLLDQNPLHLRSLLLKYLEEDLSQEREPATDTLGRKWKL